MTNIQINMQGFVTWQVGREGEKPRITSGDEPTCNLIVNSGLDLMGTTIPTSASSYCRVGTGTGATTPTMTDLVARFGAVSGIAAGTVNTNSGAAPWWHQTTRTYTFTAGTISGAALSELGFFNSNSVGATMFSRVLFLDGLGNPTTVTLLPDEVLTVSYAIRKYVPMADATGTFNITGVGTVNYTVRAANAGNSSAWGAERTAYPSGSFEWRETQTLGLITSQPAGVNFNSGASPSGYSNGTYQRSVSTSLALAEANFATGIGSVCTIAGVISNFQVSFTPKIPKDATKTLNMSNFFTVSWAAGAP